MNRRNDTTRYMLSRPIVGEPGATWTYVSRPYREVS
jgi:hypothetical protein